VSSRVTCVHYHLQEGDVLAVHCCSMKGALHWCVIGMRERGAGSGEFWRAKIAICTSSQTGNLRPRMAMLCAGESAMKPYVILYGTVVELEEEKKKEERLCGLQPRAPPRTFPDADAAPQRGSGCTRTVHT
jgi:hypothetical protein